MANAPTKPASAKIEIHGHRGSRGTHPENSIPAFAEAVASGAEWLELDLQLSKDDVPVVSHDPELSPTHCLGPDGKKLTAPIAIRTLTAKEISTYDCGTLTNPRFPEQKSIPGTRIPTLAEFLTWAKKNAPGQQYNIETKMEAPKPEWIADPDVFARIVVEVLKSHGAISKTVLQSFDFRTLRAARKIAPELRLSCLFEHEKNFCEKTQQEHAAFASPEASLVTAAEVAKCHQVGIQVVPWTANTPEVWNQLITSKVDAIITDYPRQLRTRLSEK